MVASRNNNSTLSNAVLENENFDMKLCNMNIVNELAMLNQYYAKNNVASNESADIESSISVDGSRTSENKLNDFVDYESTVSVDGSRPGENNINDFVDESSLDETGGGDRSQAAEPKSVEEPEPKSEEELEPIECIAVIEENGKEDDSTMVWSDHSEDEMNTEDELDLEFEELEEELDELEEKKKVLEKRFNELYRVVLQASFLFIFDTELVCRLAR